MHREVLTREAKERGQSITMIDIRYILSAIDSPFLIPTCCQPSRFVAFDRSQPVEKG
jgi:hypothetical protein